MLPPVRNPFASPLWRNRRSSASGRRRRSRSSARSSPGSRCRSRRSWSSGSGALEVASCAASTSSRRSSFGLVAGAWVDRLRRRPVLIWADLGRAALLGSIPVAVRAGRPGVPAAPGRVRAGRDPDDVLRRRRQRLPADDRRARAAGRRQQRPRRERLGRGVHGLRHQRLPRPAADARRSRSPSTRSRSWRPALLLGTIRRPEAPPPPPEDREPVLTEIRDGLAARPPRPGPARVRRGADVARRRCGASSGRPGSCSSSTTSQLEPGRARRRRRGRRRLVVHRRRDRDARDPALGRRAGGHRRDAARRRSATRSSRWRRPGCRSSRSAAWSCSSSSRDSAVTVYDITEVSVRQTLVHDRALGRVDVDVPRRGDARPARRDAGGRAPGRGASACARRHGWRRSAACSAAAILWFVAGPPSASSCRPPSAADAGRGRPARDRRRDRDATSRPARRREPPVRRRAPPRTRRGRTGAGRRPPPPPRRSGPGP